MATHDEPRFASIWTWTKDNLQEPSGLFAYDWSDGAIVGSGAATDADLNTAWALVLGAKTFHDPAYEKDGLAVASAVLANETVVSAGRLELVAGPWARERAVPGGPELLLAPGHGGVGIGFGQSELDPTGGEQPTAGGGAPGRGLRALPPPRLGAAGGVGGDLRLEPPVGR